jgi:hypothetical protein
VLGGLMLFPLSRGDLVLQSYRTWAAELPDEFTTMAVVITAPPAPFVPEHLAGQKVVGVVGCWCGDPDAGDEALAPLRDLQPAVDVFAAMPYRVLQGMLDDGAPPGRRNYARSGYTAELTDGLVEIVLDHGARMPSPYSQIHFHHLGGAVARVAEADTAFSNRRAAYAYNLVSSWEDASEDDLHESANRELATVLGGFSTGGVYVNFLGDEGDARVRSAYGANYRRLTQLKKRFDPHNLFNLNQNIAPAA